MIIFEETHWFCLFSQVCNCESELHEHNSAMPLHSMWCVSSIMVNTKPYATPTRNTLANRILVRLQGRNNLA